MKLPFFQSQIADIGRLQEIASTFIRYGFGDLVNSMGLGDQLEKAGKFLKLEEAEDIAQLGRPQRFRRVFETLGPTFVKLGQIFVFVENSKFKIRQISTTLQATRSYGPSLMN